MKKIDLKWGHPDFMADYWNTPQYEKLSISKPSRYMTRHSPELEQAIKLLHIQEDNVHPDALSYNLIIGNGATQLLYAALYAKRKINGDANVLALSPYFSRLPIIAELSDFDFQTNCYYPHQLQIVTTPNNPDGKFQEGTGNNLIHDMVYHWNQYNHELGIYAAKEDIMIFSLAKATGHASTRIGWAFVKDDEIAKEMKNYIEFSTSGVSIDAQEKAYEVIMNSISLSPSPFFYGKLKLASRWKELYNVEDRLTFDLKSKNGMFIYGWHENPDQYFGDRNIEFLSGTEFGSDKNHFRINLGCSDKDFNELLWRIVE